MSKNEFKDKERYKYILMHKDVEVAEILMTDDGHIININDVYEPQHLPVGTLKNGKCNSILLNTWWAYRAIPTTRKGINEVLQALNIGSTQALSARCLGLSLSEHYWIKPYGANLSWESINFFDNAFSEELGDTLLGFDTGKAQIDLKHIGNIDSLSPDSTSNGNLKKRWKIINGERVLLKAGTFPYQQEPFNEKIASALMKRLGIPHISYDVVWIDELPYSVCPCFTDKNTELVTAYSVLASKNKPNHQNFYQHYINLCNEAGVRDIQTFMDKMIVVDYIIANEDRHTNNFGLLRNADTLEFISAAPVYDSGTSLLYNKPVDIPNRSSIIECKPWYETHDKQLKLVSSLDWFDASKLDGFGEEMANILEPLKEKGYVDEKRVNGLVEFVESRISYIKSLSERKTENCEEAESDVLDLTQEQSCGRK